MEGKKRKEEAYDHQRATVIVFDIPSPVVLFEDHVGGKSLLFEVPNGVIVSVRQKILDVGVGCDVVLQM